MRQMINSIVIIMILTVAIVIQSPAQTGAYTLNGGTATQTGQTYSSSTIDQSGVYVLNSGNLTLTNCTVTTSGNTSSQDNSSFYGLNAGVLAKSGSKIVLNNCKINTSGTGANGVFAEGAGSSVVLTNDSIICSKEGGHGVDATNEGSLTLNNVYINTSGAHGAAISTDRGGGTIVVKGGQASASGQDSPGIYCTGNITVSDAIIKGVGAEAAVIEGENSITLTNTTLSAAKGTKDWGIFIYQSMSGDATGNKGVFTMTGGSYSWPSSTGPAFYVTNTNGVINLSHVTINSNSSILLKASANLWGNSGSNGGNVALTADNQTLSGNIITDSYSSVSISLKNNSSLSGTINKAAITIDGTSTWEVSGDSYLTIISDDSGISGTSITNITGNGYNVYYDATLSANSALEGKTYSLVNGGVLAPNGSTSVDQQENGQPTGYKLNQNYPNPFNPSTTISYQISTAGHVALQVFDALGREVSEIVNEDKLAGSYSVTFDAQNLPSGIYIYRITGTKFVQSKKMLFIK